ncbi:hypothetical protein [Arthrobacter sp. LAPM80]|uniref:hypothetical protein n=1 Tax=Arthrobacter sp. LAPM80 TaxID=3141788 RepID=UPI00398B91E9
MAQVRTSPIRTFLPAATARFAANRQKNLAETKGALVPAVSEVLFVRVHNASRFQMAAVLVAGHSQWSGEDWIRRSPSVIEVEAPADTSLGRGWC